MTATIDLVDQHTTPDQLRQAGVGSEFRYRDTTYTLREEDVWTRETPGAGITTWTTDRLIERGRHGNHYTWSTYIPAAETVGQQIGLAYTVGTHIDTVEQANELPIGTVLACGSACQFRKVNADRWQRIDLGGERDRPAAELFVTHNGSDDARQLRVHAPVPEWEGLQVGTVLAPRDSRIDQLPLGTEITHITSRYRRTDEGWMYVGGGRDGVLFSVDREQFSGSQNTIALLPVVERIELDTALPGSVIHRTHRSGPNSAEDFRRFVKRDDGRWHDQETGANYGRRHMTGTYYWERKIMTATEAPPEIAGLTQGSQLTRGQFDALPVGAIVRDRNGRGTDHVKQANGLWYKEGYGDTNYTDILRDMLRGGAIRFHSMGTEARAFAVGAIMTAELFAAAPIGSVIEYVDDPTSKFTKVDDTHWCAGVGTSATGTQYRGADFGYSRYRYVRGPQAAPAPVVVVPPGCPQIGERFTTRQQVRDVPVGTAITNGDALTDGGSYFKVSENGWGSSEGGRVVFRDADIATNYHRIRSYPVILTPEQIAAVEAVKAEAIRAVNECVSYQGSWSWVRDGAFRLLGINPMPAIDTEVSWGSAFGLPVESVVRVTNANGRARLFRVANNDTAYPEHLAGDTTVDVPTDYNVMVQVLALGAFDPPVYTGRNDFLRQLWAKQRTYRSVHRWCSAVETCLNNAGLQDPGDTPDVYVTADPLVVGQTIDHRTTDADVAQLRALPIGSTINIDQGGPGHCVRTNSSTTGWARLSDLSQAGVRDMVGVTILSIPGPAPVSDDEPF